MLRHWVRTGRRRAKIGSRRSGSILYGACDWLELLHLNPPKSCVYMCVKTQILPDKREMRVGCSAETRLKQNQAPCNFGGPVVGLEQVFGTLGNLDL